jgi:hypothetical protein
MARSPAAQLQSRVSNCIVEHWNVLMAFEEIENGGSRSGCRNSAACKQQNKGLMAAAKSRRNRYIGLAAKAKNKEAKERYKQIAKNIMLQGTAAAKRLQISADNAADSYARSMRQAAEAPPAPKAVEVKKTKT